MTLSHRLSHWLSSVPLLSYFSILLVKGLHPDSPLFDSNMIQESIIFKESNISNILSLQDFPLSYRYT